MVLQLLALLSGAVFYLSDPSSTHAMLRGPIHQSCLIHCKNYIQKRQSNSIRSWSRAESHETLPSRDKIIDSFNTLAEPAQVEVVRGVFRDRMTSFYKNPELDTHVNVKRSIEASDEVLNALLSRVDDLQGKKHWADFFDETNGHAIQEKGDSFFNKEHITWHGKLVEQVPPPKEPSVHSPCVTHCLTYIKGRKDDTIVPWVNFENASDAPELQTQIATTFINLPQVDQVKIVRQLFRSRMNDIHLGFDSEVAQKEIFAIDDLLNLMVPLAQKDNKPLWRGFISELDGHTHPKINKINEEGMTWMGEIQKIRETP